MGIIEINITRNIKREREEHMLQMSENTNELMRIHSKPQFN